MLKIGDFSKLGQVSTRMLRHYDKLGLLKPSQTDQWTGYRYYTIDQLPRLHRIMALKELGLSLEQIAQLLDKGDDLPTERMRGMLLMRQAQLETELQEKHSQLARVEARLQQIEQYGQPSPYEVVVKPLPAQHVASLRQLVPTIAQMDYYCQVMYEQLYAGLKQQGIRSLHSEITLYHNDEYTETELDVETALVVSPKTAGQALLNDHIFFRELPATDLAAALIFEGSYCDVPAAVLALLTYVGTHGHIVAGPLREFHLSGPAHEGGRVVETAVIELQVPITRTPS